MDSPYDPTVFEDDTLALDVGERTFSRGLGFFLQGLGALLLLVLTCTCCGVAFFEAGAWQSVGSAQMVQYDESGKPTGAYREADPETNASRQSNATILVGSTLGAMCLLGFGVGMQADRGKWAVAGALGSTIMMICIYVWSGVNLIMVQGWSGRVVLPFAFAMCMVVCFVLVCAAVAEVWRNPPRHAGAPTVPGDAFPDPLAIPRAKIESDGTDRPAQRSIIKERKRLQEQLDHLDAIERSLGGDKKETDPRERNVSGEDAAS